MLTEIARRAAVEFADTEAFVTEHGWSITYAQLDRAADEAATGLFDQGIRPGSVLALATPSNVDFVVLYLAAARLGAVPAGLNPRFTGSELRACIGVLNADLVIASPTLAAAMGTIDSSIAVVEAGDSAHTVAARFRVPDAAPVPDLPADPERPVCICFTSGSTGQPRGGWYANRQLQAIADLDTGGAWGGGGHGLSSVAMAHVGFMTKLPWMLASGRTTHLLERWRATLLVVAPDLEGEPLCQRLKALSQEVDQPQVVELRDYQISEMLLNLRNLNTIFLRFCDQILQKLHCRKLSLDICIKT